MLLSQLFERTDYSKAERREEADQYISQWTYSSDSLKKDNSENWENYNNAILVYPWRGVRKTVYRGLTFDTADKLAAFEKATSNFTKLNEKNFSSWTPDLAVATSYAMLDDEYNEQGFGLIIATKVPVGVDCSKSDEGEYEVIAPPADYAIKVIRKEQIKN